MDLKKLVESDQLLKLKPTIKKIFFARIAGTGMGNVAVLFKQAGFEVAGSDTAFYPPMGDYLKENEITCFTQEEVTGDLYQEYDLIVVGNVIGRNSQEARNIESCGVPFTSFPSALGAFILKERKVIGIAGTHGKTTTCYLALQVLEKLGEKPGYLIGGVINGRPSSELGESDYFLIEADEYDSSYFQKRSKFHYYELNHLILTSLEFDHADIYNSMDEITLEFSNLFKNNLSLCRSTSVGDYDYSAIVDLSKEYTNLKSYDDQFSQLEISGDHNRKNLKGVLSLFLKLGYTKDKLIECSRNLELVKRRQELRGLYQGMKVVDDFAHHPRAIRETIKAVVESYGQKVIAIYEPISATARSSLFYQDYLECFNQAETVVIADPGLKTSALSFETLNVEELVQEAQAKGKNYSRVTSLQELRDKIDGLVSSDTVLLVMSNRTCLGLWQSDFVKEIN